MNGMEWNDITLNIKIAYKMQTNEKKSVIKIQRQQSNEC